MGIYIWYEKLPQSIKQYNHSNADENSVIAASQVYLRVRIGPDWPLRNLILMTQQQLVYPLQLPTNSLPIGGTQPILGEFQPFEYLNLNNFFSTITYEL